MRITNEHLKDKKGDESRDSANLEERNKHQFMFIVDGQECISTKEVDKNKTINFSEESVLNSYY